MLISAAQRSAAQPYVSKVVASPVGELTLVAGVAGLVAILWKGEDPRRVPLPTLARSEDHPVLLETARQLDAYFAGSRTRFALPVVFNGTPFQKRVWAALLTIPFGATRTYAEIAQQIGAPKAIRAVGAANGRNPVSIVVPCHRVVGSDGQLRGFAGGLEMKEALLTHEGRVGRAGFRAL